MNAVLPHLRCVPADVPTGAAMAGRPPSAPAKLTLVLVEWLDSRRGEGWVRLSELESSVTRCRSVGWIIAKDSISVTLAGHLGENPDQCCGDVTIPRKAIGRITRLRQPREFKARMLQQPSLIQFDAREFVLYESILGPTGSRYVIREHFPLGGS
ncbi:MAG: 2'-5' RNA ligase family protein [Acidobacteriaceae bacterium]